MNPMLPKKSAWVVRNESKPSDSGPGAAHGGTEYSDQHEAEGQHEDGGRAGKAESTSETVCAAQTGAGESGTPVKFQPHTRRRFVPTQVAITL
jgi:hypothetical protein